jgi:hypothetical protein
MILKRKTNIVKLYLRIFTRVHNSPCNVSLKDQGYILFDINLLYKFLISSSQVYTERVIKYIGKDSIRVNLHDLLTLCVFEENKVLHEIKPKVIELQKIFKV